MSALVWCPNKSRRELILTYRQGKDYAERLQADQISQVLGSLTFGLDAPPLIGLPGTGHQIATQKGANMQKAKAYGSNTQL
jgi:hypothetical protein